MNKLNKKVIALLLTVFIFGLIFWRWTQIQSNIIPLDGSAVAQELIRDNFISAGDVNDQPLSIFAELVDKKTKSVVQFIEIPEWSGTGGAKGFVITYENSGHNFKVLTEFFGSKATLKESLKITDSVISYVELYHIGSCCFYSKDIQINLITGVVLAPVLDDTIEAYLSRHGIKTDGDLLSESIGNYKQTSQELVTFERRISNFKGDEFPIEIWQYNVETGEYKLIK